jgi:hypothetical protein
VNAAMAQVNVGTAPSASTPARLTPSP